MRLSAPLFALALLAACSQGPSDLNAVPPIGQKRDAVINGVLDKTHPAVVALILGENDSFEGACSGTIIARDAKRHIGWVATAAHCLDSSILHVVQGEDFGATDALVYSVIDATADPRWKSNGLYDFAIVRIGGVDASTPVMPLATSPDELTQGMTVTSVGFGTTDAGGGTNTKRYAIEKTIDELKKDRIGYEQATSGICFGDSGGPVVAGSGAAARVVGIHSYVAGGCDYRGYSVRVTEGLAFFDAELAKDLPERSCDLCRKLTTAGMGSCASITKACFDDDVCRSYRDCLAEGKKDKARCAEDYPLSEGPLVAAASCACGGDCADVCTGAPGCESVGKCGAKLKADDACVACIESSCCEAERECTADGSCYVCLEREDSFASCKGNDARKKLAACATDHCAEACAGSTLATIGATKPPSTEADAGAQGEAPPASSCQCQAGAESRTPRWIGAFAPALAFLLRRRRRHADDLLPPACGREVGECGEGRIPTA